LCIAKLDAKCFPDEGLLLRSLTSLTISRGGNLEKLNYKGLYQLSSLQTLALYQLSSLQTLALSHCPRLESFPDRGFPSNVEKLATSNCSKLASSQKGAFRDRFSLESMWISELDAECFPDEGLLPLSLTSLTIRRCPNLKNWTTMVFINSHPLKCWLLRTAPISKAYWRKVFQNQFQVFK